MSNKFFMIPAIDPAEMESELNAFCSRHRIGHVDNHFVADGGNSFWAICITWTDNTGPLAGNSVGLRKNKIDYKDVLNNEDFAIYSRLRELRKTIAEREGTPAYNIFTNEQLALIVQQRISGRSALLEVEGIGQARVDKYGDIFLKHLRELCASDASNETDQNNP